MSVTAKKLKNGLQTILVPQKAATSTTVMVYVHVGSRYENPQNNGASHFIEHLMFKGTKRRPDSLLISKELDRYGAEYNAFTSKDATAYYVKIESEQTPLAIDLLHDMLTHSLFDPKEIDRERGVILEEINMYEDNPRTHMEDLLEGALFPEHPLGWKIIGPREVIKTISRDALLDYRNAYYIPSRMTVVVAGHIESNVLSLINKTFGTLKQSETSQDIPFHSFLVPAKLPHPIAFQSKKTEQVQLGLAFHGCAFNDKRLPTVSLLATILGGSMSSRLFVEVRERRGLCYAISASHQPMEDTGEFAICAGLERNRVHEAFTIIWKELEKTKTKRIGSDELRRAKDHVRGKLLLAFEDSSTQANWYGKQWTFERSLHSPEERLKHIESVTATQIQKCAQDIFKPEIMAKSLIGPFKKDEGVDHLVNLN